jgi:hypothetical protein
MQTIAHTNTDKVRSVLGVDAKDVTDLQITDRDIEKELLLDLLSWVPTHATLYTTGTTSYANSTDKSIADAIGLYCTYFCSILMLKSLQLATPQTVSDGKNSMNRFATMDWSGLASHLKERAAFYKLFVQDSTYVMPVVQTYNPFAGVGLINDPTKTG